MAAIDILKKALPFIAGAAGTAVGGGGLGTIAAEAVSKALGGKEVKPDVDSIAQAVVGATPEQWAALQQAEMDFKLKMQQLGFQNVSDLEAIAEKDRESARNRQVAMKDWTPTIMGFLILLGFFAISWWVFVHGVAPNVQQLADILLGALTTMAIAVVTYYFGSSAGSDRKTEILANQKPQGS